MRTATLAVSLLGLVACTTQATLPDPSTYIDAKHPKSIWVTRGDSVTRVDRPHTSDAGDTIFGVTAGRPVTIPLADVRRVSASQTNYLTTLLAAGGLTVAAYILFFPR